MKTKKKVKTSVAKFDVVLRALHGLMSDLMETGEDKHPETRKEYRSCREARVVLEKYHPSWGDRKKLSGKMDLKHVRNLGRSCPYCESENLSGEDREFNAGTATLEVRCVDCGAQYKEIYRLVDVIFIDKSDGM